MTCRILRHIVLPGNFKIPGLACLSSHFSPHDYQSLSMSFTHADNMIPLSPASVAKQSPRSSVIIAPFRPGAICWRRRWPPRRLALPQRSGAPLSSPVRRLRVTLMDCHSRPEIKGRERPAPKWIDRGLSTGSEAGRDRIRPKRRPGRQS